MAKQKKQAHKTPTINKRALGDLVAHQIREQNLGVDRITKADAIAIIDIITDEIVKAVSDGKRVRLTNFGLFETRVRSERNGRNPQTGELLRLGKSVIPGFKPGRQFREAVKDANK